MLKAARDSMKGLSSLTLPHERDCPNVRKHTPRPEGYLEWHYWAGEKVKTHRQIRCPGCGLLRIWVKR